MFNHECETLKCTKKIYFVLLFSSLWTDELLTVVKNDFTKCFNTKKLYVIIELVKCNLLMQDTNVYFEIVLKKEISDKMHRAV